MSIQSPLNFAIDLASRLELMLFMRLVLALKFTKKKNYTASHVKKMEWNKINSMFFAAHVFVQSRFLRWKPQKWNQLEANNAIIPFKLKSFHCPCFLYEQNRKSISFAYDYDNLFNGNISAVLWKYYVFPFFRFACGLKYEYVLDIKGKQFFLLSIHAQKML